MYFIHPPNFPQKERLTLGAFWWLCQGYLAAISTNKNPNRNENKHAAPATSASIISEYTVQGFVLTTTAR
jgi:hypothetical protein